MSQRFAIIGIWTVGIVRHIPLPPALFRRQTKLFLFQPDTFLSRYKKKKFLVRNPLIKFEDQSDQTASVKCDCNLVTQETVNILDWIETSQELVQSDQRERSFKLFKPGLDCFRTSRHVREWLKEYWTAEEQKFFIDV